MKRKTIARILCCALALGMLSGCADQTTGSTPQPQTASRSSGAENATWTKPEKITMMVDGTLVTPDKGQEEFEALWEEKTGIDLEIIQPDHDVYYDAVKEAFASGNLPDVVLLSSTYYTEYAAEDMLADISNYYQGSALEKRIQDAGNADLIEGIRIHGKLYGITPTRGNGCVTYVKKAWLDKCGLSAPTNYEEYLAMLQAFTERDPDGNGRNGDTYGVSAAGLINSEAPYTNYLPEFYQDAYPAFYQKEDGTWVDGFTEEPMREALQRLQTAYKAGYIDPNIVENSTGNSRDKFYAEEYGAFTYWAGTWGNTLSNKLKEAGVDDELVALLPIAETGDYLERVAPVWCITSACKNPGGVYEYFLETMLDGGEIETLWTYSPTSETYAKNHIDRMLAIVPIQNDPGAGNASAKANAAAEVFNSNSKMADLPYSTEAYALYNSQLMTLKTELINSVVVNGQDIDEAYSQFDAQNGNWMSQAIVDSLNAE
ncbi:MAG: extracellular solute-binding protein [Lachnospiraceae bacterium]|nr:extracellular solute-binding protein [Lachnospiraceae bacterium]